MINQTNNHHPSLSPHLCSLYPLFRAPGPQHVLLLTITLNLKTQLKQSLLRLPPLDSIHPLTPHR